MIKPAILAAALMLAPAPAFAANLLTNGGFETGNFTGWSQFGSTDATGVSGFFSPYNPTQGAFQAYFGPFSSRGGITQSFSTQVGKTYTFTFDAAAFEGGSLFDAAIGGVSKLTVFGGAWDYTSYSFSHVATATTTAVTFTMRHIPLYYMLDNVSVTGSVPEPHAWAMLIAGFGLVGAAARRRRNVAAA
jgi:MYXO-CTERM domain-containing protein